MQYTLNYIVQNITHHYAKCDFYYLVGRGLLINIHSPSFSLSFNDEYLSNYHRFPSRFIRTRDSYIYRLYCPHILRRKTIHKPAYRSIMLLLPHTLVNIIAILFFILSVSRDRSIDKTLVDYSDCFIISGSCWCRSTNSLKDKFRCLARRKTRVCLEATTGSASHWRPQRLAVEHQEISTQSS